MSDDWVVIPETEADYPVLYLRSEMRYACPGREDERLIVLPKGAATSIQDEADDFGISMDDFLRLPGFPTARMAWDHYRFNKEVPE